MKCQRPTHLDLFSGIGGFALAAEWAGFTTIGFSEINPYASRILAQHWPGVPNYGDVRNVPRGRCDLLTGGFPCQPFSQLRQSGERKGKGDHRYLWPAMLQVIDAWRPAWVVGENVNGIVGVALDAVLADLEASHYACQALIIPACALDAGHIRQRVWILAYAAGERRAANEEVHDSATGQSGGTELEGRKNRRRFVQLAASNRGAVKKLEYELPVAIHLTGDRGGADGLSAELDRVEALGNAIVPQVAHQILQAIYDLIP